MRGHTIKSFIKLFELTIELQKVFIENDQEPWFSVTFLVNSSGKLNVYFDYSDWHDSEFDPSARIKYFEYKYLGETGEN
ncbi:immunity protein YezG family protein [Sutcliffiella horikoshii]|uniref:immunity protein YezG family protein n=1 Tax=Sutcliffiella horikoshii TaxID=79883 RepID=UPI00299E29B2|nr:immunity protein YezG family protein [Sutcliffiella horikoshii]